MRISDWSSDVCSSDLPSRGREAAAAQAFLIDQIIRLLYDATIQYLYPINNPTLAERIAIMGVGGYGRGEMAPHSDVDIAFITPYTPTGWPEQVIESMLYSLWDFRLEVGPSDHSKIGRASGKDREGQ